MLVLALRIRNNFFKPVQWAHVLRKIICNWMLRFKKMKDNNMNIQSSEHILLTGAGFTKNFGAPLASEMWAHIFNHKKIQAQSRIKELMQNCFDYESIYYYIMEGVMKRSCPDDEKYTDGEKDAIDDGVKSAYEYIDTILRGFIKNHQRPNELYNINELISKFSETGSDCYTGINNVKYHVYPETNVKSLVTTHLHSQMV